jgi:hypothetical protein
MELNLAMAAAALSLVAHAPAPAGDAPAAARPGHSFVQLAGTLDVVSVTPPSRSEAGGRAPGIPQPGTWSLLAMGAGVVALFATRNRR